MDESYQNESEINAEEKKERVRMELYDWLQCIVTAIICGVLIFILVGRTIGVEGRSMIQTLLNSDRVVISNMFYTPGNGDIIVFQSPSEQFEYPLVKRVIAIENQTVSINFDEGNVYIDGVKEPEFSGITTKKHDFNDPVTVPPGFVFVLGDNRDSSTDSRDSSIGLVDTRYILGKVIFLLIPGTDEFGNRDWSRLGFVS